MRLSWIIIEFELSFRRLKIVFDRAPCSCHVRLKKPEIVYAHLFLPSFVVPSANDEEWMCWFLAVELLWPTPYGFWSFYCKRLIPMYLPDLLKMEGTWHAACESKSQSRPFVLILSTRYNILSFTIFRHESAEGHLLILRYDLSFLTPSELSWEYLSTYLRMDLAIVQPG